MSNWNMLEYPISTRLRDHDEIKLITENKYLIYHKQTQQTALIVEAYIVDDGGFPEDTYEDRYVQYVVNEQYKEDWSTDLDDEGWTWFDELQGATSDT